MRLVTELRLTGRTPDAMHLTLTDGEESEYTLRISDTLRATVNQPRLSSVPENDSPTVTVREIQARLRAGEPMESIARDSNTSLEKIERFSGPILQERTYIIDMAQSVVMRKESGRDPVNFYDVVISRLAPRQVDITAVEWNTWRLEDGSWIIRIHYPNRDGLGVADWSFDTTRRSLVALDDGARWMVGEEIPPQKSVDHGLVYGAHPAARTPEPEVTITPREAPRLISIRVDPEPEAAADGVTSRAKVPSWDEIMFGTTKKNDEDLED